MIFVLTLASQIWTTKTYVPAEASPFALADGLLTFDNNFYINYFYSSVLSLK